MKQRHNAPRKSQTARQKALNPEQPRGVSKAAAQAEGASGPTRKMAVQSFEPEPNAVFSIDATAQIAGVPRRNILIYCKHGLISPITDPTLWGYWFSTDAIRTLRRIESLRNTCGDDFPGIAMILDLINEVQVLRAQLRSTV